MDSTAVGGPENAFSEYFDLRAVLRCLFNFLSIICPLVAYGKLKTKKKSKFLALKVVAVAYERWLLWRGFNDSDLTWKDLVFWKSGRLGEVVATGGSTVLLLLNSMANNKLHFIV